MISTRGRYALRVMTDLAQHSDDGYIPLKSIAQRQNLSQKYLESTPIIRGINGTELVDLILKYYDQLADKYRKMIPLRMVYIPVATETQEML